MIYFDHAATTAINKNILSDIGLFLGDRFANPSSSHTLGKLERKFLNDSRETIARLFNVESETIYFANSATNAANIILQGYCDFIKTTDNSRTEIIISELEHPAVYKTAEYLQSKGFKLLFARVNEHGLIDMDYLQGLLSKRTAMVAIMSVNNEVGVIQDIPSIATLVKKIDKKIFFISDFVQGIGKVPQEYLRNVDSWFIAGHKIGAPKGIACFYLNSNFKINPILFGGGQEKNLVPGTSDSVMAALLTKCIEDILSSFEVNNKKYHILREHLLSQLQLHEIDYKLIIPESFATASILSIDFLKIKASYLAAALEKNNIFVSTRSACSSFCFEDSHVIRVLQIRKNQRISPIRISFSHLNEKDEIDIFVKTLREILNEH